MSDLTRRVFLGQAGVAAVAGAAAAGETRRSSASKADRYRPLVGQTFRVSSDGKTWTTCVLDEVNDLGPAPREDFAKPASLMFSTRDGAVLPTGTYTVAHRSLPATRLLITQVDRDQKLESILG